MRKKVVLGMSAFLLSFLMVGCQKDRVEGVYKYVETKGDDSFYTMGIKFRCALIGDIEFRGGKCYVSVQGVQKRMDYDVEGNRIYVKVDGTEEIIEIIDDKKISTAGCIFVKQ